MGLVHEFKEFVDYGFQESPVSSKEARILSDNVHYVGGNDGLVVLPLLLLAQTKEILNNGLY